MANPQIINQNATQWVFPTEADRLAYVPLNTDRYKVAYVEYTDLSYILASISPVEWTPLAGPIGWRDLIGTVRPKISGVGSPTLDTLTGNVRAFRYAVGEDGDNDYHIPHDYLPGSDLFFHPHWTHNGTNISGSLEITVYMTYAKGHQQASFHTQKIFTVTDSGLTIANTPQLFHRIPEVQMSTPGGSASQLDSNIIEVDGLIQLHYDVTTIPTITGGATKPFLLTMDIHYQSTGLATPQKAPNFYTP